MCQWFMLTLVGKDQVGIVAKITSLLYQQECNLGEASMLRLGGNFTMMLMVKSTQTADKLLAKLQPLANELDLKIHLDLIDGSLHAHQQPNIAITVHGADRAGIVAQVTTDLAAAGLDIVDLTTDVGGSTEQPFYIMQIAGVATQGVKSLELALQSLLQRQPDLQVDILPIETMMM